MQSLREMARRLGLTAESPDPPMHRFYQRYRLVAAAPIVKVAGDSVTVSVDGVERDIGVPPEFFESGVPNPGDYLVAYPDPGTTVLWEKKADFEFSYTLEGTGPEGPQGEQGETGPQGPQGDQGIPGPSIVSADAGNIAVIGSDDFILVSNTSTFMGVTDGSDAADGQIGQYLTADNIDGVAMAANVAASVCTIPLPPGCWEIWGACDFTVAAIGVEIQATPIQPNQLGASVSVTPDSLPTDEELILGTGVMQLIYSPLAAGQRQVLITGQCRSNSTEEVDLYLVAQIGLGNATVRGYLSARRVR